MTTLNTAFKQVYREALVPYGFVLIKSKYPYFVRLVEGCEIIHVITCRSEGMGSYGRIEFSVIGGIATIYRKSIDLTKSPSSNINWLSKLSEFYYRLNPLEYNKELCDCMNFNYAPNDSDSMFCEMERSLQLLKQFTIPVLDDVSTLRDCIEYFYTLNVHVHQFIQGKEDFATRDPDDEGILHVKTRYYGEFMNKKLQKDIAEYPLKVKAGWAMYTEEQYSEICKRFESETSHERINRYDRIFDDKEWVDKANQETEYRKKENIEKLRSYGLNI